MMMMRSKKMDVKHGMVFQITQTHFKTTNKCISANAKMEKKFVQIIAPLLKLKDLLNQAHCQGNV